MSFGYSRERRIALNDSITITAKCFLDDEVTLIPLASIQNVTFSVVTPTDLVTAPTVNAAAADQIPLDGTAIFTVPAATNVGIGEYHAIARFTYIENAITKQKTVFGLDYNVIDPFERVAAGPADPAIDMCWQKLADCFDSELGGPWLRDMTLARFDKSRIAGFLPDVITEINFQQPQTAYDQNSFPYSSPDGVTTAGQGLLVHTLRHLMRAYTEQPDQTNSPVGFFDRTKYAQAWGAIYTLELDRWNKWLGAYKLRIYNSSSTKLLVASKAGRLLPAPLRGRNIGRGYY